MVTFHCFKLFHPTLFMDIYVYSYFFGLFLAISPLGYFWLFYVICGYFLLF
jgi:hypothetical protein